MVKRSQTGAGLFAAASALALVLFACADRQGSSSAIEAPSWSLYGQARVAESEAGMVVSGHPLSSQVGARVLERGGNAIDAAVATGFAQAVVLPRAGNIGGGGFLVYRGADGDVRALDFRETAPAAASRNMFVDEKGDPTELSVTGHLAAGVPGSVAGLWEMHQQLGTLPWAELVAPAIELAGAHELDEVRSGDIAGSAERLARFEASAAQFLVDGKAPPAGTIFRQPDLAQTLRQVAEHGADGFYRGPVARLIVDEMERGGGAISARDLADYRPVWRQVVEAQYRGYTIYSMPPPSSGGLTLALILNLLEGFDPLPAFGTTELAHLHAEVMRLAFIDRNRFMGDPDFVDIPFDRLQSQAYADELRSSIDPQRASPTPIYVEPTVEGTETTHYSIVDSSGNAVSITTTINSSFGNAVTVAGAGFLLNNEMDDFATAPGKPNQFGLVEGENNAIVPGKRMLSSMTPSIVLDRSGELFMIVGTPGGPTIITSVFHAISNVLDHSMSPAAAVESPRVHHQALPDRLYVEPAGLSAEVLQGLRDYGHEIMERASYSGDVAAILRLEERWIGVADPRRGGAPAPAEPSSP